MPPKRTRAPPKPANSSPNNKNNKKNTNFVLGNNAATSSSNNNNNNNFIVGSNNNNNNGAARRPAKKSRVVQAPVGVAGVAMQAAAPRQAASRARGPPKPKLAALQGLRIPMKAVKMTQKVLVDKIKSFSNTRMNHLYKLCKRDADACPIDAAGMRELLIKRVMNRSRSRGVVDNKALIRKHVLDVTAEAVAEGAAAEIAKNASFGHNVPPATEQQTAAAVQSLLNGQASREVANPNNPAFRADTDILINKLMGVANKYGIVTASGIAIGFGDVAKTTLVGSRLVKVATVALAGAIWPFFEKYGRTEQNVYALKGITVVPFLMAGLGAPAWSAIGIIIATVIGNEGIFHRKEWKDAWTGIEGQDWILQLAKYIGGLATRYIVAILTVYNPYSNALKKLLGSGRVWAGVFGAGSHIAKGFGTIGVAFGQLFGDILHGIGHNLIPGLKSGGINAWRKASAASSRLRNALTPHAQRWGRNQKIAAPTHEFWKNHQIEVDWWTSLKYWGEDMADLIREFTLTHSRYVGMALIIKIFMISSYINRVRISRIRQGLQAKIGAYRVKRKADWNAKLANRLAKAKRNSNLAKALANKISMAHTNHQ
jgi:hypothetical protein